MKKWYENKNQDSDIVISTRIRLARNLKSFPFKSKITDEQQKELNTKVINALKSGNFVNNQFKFIYLNELTDVQQMAFVEKHLVSYEFVQSPANGLICLSDDNSISIMVNEEDHIRIQVLSSGMDLQNAFGVCNKIDDLLDEQLEYAFDESLGYLTACPTNIGTGLRASLMLHLPALEKTQTIGKLMKTVSSLGLTIRGTYGEGTRVIGSTYQLSNKITLGLSEEKAIENLQNIARQIIETEKSIREKMLDNNIGLLDELYRSYGILKNARLLSSNEFYEHISNVRLLISQGFIDNSSIESINELYNIVGSSTLCAEEHKQYTSKERDFYRAKKVRELL